MMVQRGYYNDNLSRQPRHELPSNDGREILARRQATRKVLDLVSFTLPSHISGEELAGLACAEVITIIGPKLPDQRTGLENAAMRLVESYLSDQ